MDAIFSHRISIIVPVYNVEEWLPRCLDSIIAQTFTDFEVILVDDGSTDSSGLICSEYTKKDCRIVLATQKNSGVSSARNHGLLLHKGEYVAFVDSDDYLEPTYLEELLNGIRDADLSVVGSIQEKSSAPIEINQFEIVNSCDVMHVFIDNLSKGHQGAFVWNKLFHSRIIREHNLRFDTSITMWEDGLFVLNYCACVANGKVGISNAQVYHYVIRGGAFFGNFKIKELSVLDAMESGCSIIRDYFPDSMENFIMKKSAFVQRTLYRMHSSDMDTKTEQHRFQKILRRDLLICIKSSAASLSMKLICALMSFNVPIACWVKDLYRKREYGTADFEK